jgi:putative flippase GtrA
MTVRARLGELFRFGIVGGSATLAYLIFAVTLDWILPYETVYISFFAHSLAALLSFYGHRYFTFAQQDHLTGQGVRFVLSTLLGFCVAISIPIVFHMFAPNVIYIMVATVGATLSFLLLKFFVFSGS